MMARRSIFVAARHLRAVCILGSAFAVVTTIYAADTVSATVGASSASTSGKNVTTSLNSAKPVSKPNSKPRWSDLTSRQQQALAPLSAEWDKLEPIRKKKWLEIGNKFSTMKPDEQARVQERMREWVKLTPEQRRVARESFARAKKLNPDQKSAQWQQYQQLPEEQKKKLAIDASSKKHIANLPSTHSKTKTLAPIKSTPKPILEKSVTPQAANQSGIPQVPQPTAK